jgi:S-adenosylhomocysteine hydrolase
MRADCTEQAVPLHAAAECVEQAIPEVTLQGKRVVIIGAVERGWAVERRVEPALVLVAETRNTQKVRRECVTGLRVQGVAV